MDFISENCTLRGMLVADVNWIVVGLIDGIFGASASACGIVLVKFRFYDVVRALERERGLENVRR